jgi:hypothetical protein
MSSWDVNSGAAGSYSSARGLQRRSLGASGPLRIPFPLVTISGKPVQYKGDDLDPERGPGLGCFRFQLVVLAIFIVLTPLSVVWQWPDAVSAGLLFAVIILLLVTGQTIIFLLRLVAADRRGRRRPLGSATRTVGELEDAAQAEQAQAEQLQTGEAPADEPPAGEARAEKSPAGEAPADPPAQGEVDPPPSDEGAVRQ